MRTAVLIPVKSFAAAKSRLSTSLDGPAREQLARQLAEAVVEVACAAAGVESVVVVSDDTAVLNWAEVLGVGHERVPPGLNAAIATGRTSLSDSYERIVIAHADLAQPWALADVIDDDGWLIVPDRHGRGTNVLVLPTNSPFETKFGGGSYHLHLAEASRLGLTLHVWDQTALSWDVDVEADLAGISAPLLGHPFGGAA